MEIIERILNFFTENPFKKNKKVIEVFITTDNKKPFKKIPKIYIKK